MTLQRMFVPFLATALFTLPAQSGARADAPTVTKASGEVNFQISCGPAFQKTFKEAVWTLHSFWYPEALKGFTAVTKAEPSCAMGYWGIAMSHWYPLWYPLSPAALKAGAEAVEKAVAAGPKTNVRRTISLRSPPSIATAPSLIITLGLSPTRRRWNKSTCATPRIAGLVFYGLALNASALPTDKTYANQRKAAEDLNRFGPSSQITLASSTI